MATPVALWALALFYASASASAIGHLHSLSIGLVPMRPDRMSFNVPLTCSEDVGDDDDVPDPLQLLPETVLVQNTYNEHHLSVVRITLRGGKQGVPHGTGFVVHNDGTSCLILTCDHVIEESRRCNLMQVCVKFEAMDDEVSAQVMHSTEASDLALLHVPAGAVPECSPLEFSDETDLSGREVVLLGYFGVDSGSLLTTPASSSEPVRESEVLESIVANYTSERGTSATVKSVLKDWLGRDNEDMAFKEMLQPIADGAQA
ncbi:uncharacterized protein C2845_PM03G35670 [Panicum miliaceum]|uniref:Uncharacterized protein n=1 Tax=Panicum miliaceum TaxID=4540 RepID=A0A3L6T9U5_PANMI|nr:uncharacterized protein C2845_PM03G35670 [Panicum miliaceum]